MTWWNSAVNTDSSEKIWIPVIQWTWWEFSAREFSTFCKCHRKWRGHLTAALWRGSLRTIKGKKFTISACHRVIGVCIIIRSIIFLKGYSQESSRTDQHACGKLSVWLDPKLLRPVKNELLKPFSLF